MNVVSTLVRVNVFLPADVVRALRAAVPPHERARFIAEAVERELRRLQLEAALVASAGAWQDADHPELADGLAIDRWIDEGRTQLGWDRSGEA